MKRETSRNAVLTTLILQLCGCTEKPAVNASGTGSVKVDPPDVELTNIFAEVYSGAQARPSTVKSPAAGPPTVESLYAEWVAELRNGIVGVTAEKGGILVGPGFSDAQRIPHLVSGKRLAEFRPRIDMVNYCIQQYNSGDPIAGLIGYVFEAAYPEQLAGIKYPEILVEAKRLAEAEGL